MSDTPSLRDAIDAVLQRYQSADLAHAEDRGFVTDALLEALAIIARAKVGPAAFREAFEQAHREKP